MVRETAPRAKGAASVHTEAVTQRVAAESSHNLTDPSLRALTPRWMWLPAVEDATRVIRFRCAEKLEARGYALARERLRKWRGSGLVMRQETTDRSAKHPEYVRLGGSQPWRDRVTVKNVAEDDDQGQVCLAPTKWHASRARNQRLLFRRIELCGGEAGTKITLTCRGGCGQKTAIEIGCGSAWFCPPCRRVRAARFRLDFDRKRLGLVTAAARAGLTRRNQPRGMRWGARLVTLTLPHVGSPRERIRVLLEVWARFWRVLRDDLVPKLQANSGITIADVPRGFSERVQGDELALADLLSYVRVLEWTPGTDGLGHPHLHVWLFSRFIEHSTIKALWEEAHEHVTGKRADLVVDVRRAGDDVSQELIKYLTKDWDVTPDGAKRVRPEVFAQVYAELVGKRLRQSSSGFGMWAVAKFAACPCCGFERERGHWARVDLTHALETHSAMLGVPDGAPRPEGERVPLTAADTKLHREYLENRDLEWSESFELRIFASRVERAGGVIGLAAEPVPEVPREPLSGLAEALLRHPARTLRPNKR